MSRRLEIPKSFPHVWLTRSHAYQSAAVVYFLYGVVYLAGAIAQLTTARQMIFFGFVPWWAFYVVGAVLVVSLPVLVWRRYLWFTRILAFGPAAKALSLLATGEPSNLYNWFFGAVAIVAAVFLFRAGWGPQEKKTAERQESA